MNEGWSDRGNRSTAHCRPSFGRPKTDLASIAGRHLGFAIHSVMQREYGEIFMPARFAAKGRNAQVSPDESKHGVHMFRRNALKGQIAANRTVGVERIAERHQPGVEARTATLAAPGVDTDSTQNVIGSRLAARSTRTVVLTDGTDHLGGWIRLRMALRIGQMFKVGKSRRYRLPGYNSSRGCYAELYR